MLNTENIQQLRGFVDFQSFVWSDIFVGSKEQPNPRARFSARIFSSLQTYNCRVLVLVGGCDVSHQSPMNKRGQIKIKLSKFQLFNFDLTPITLYLHLTDLSGHPGGVLCLSF